ncbi:MAG TPA: branched-chain amino acid ABC transporter permease [Desulfomonilaceae bacterium]|nr:branched-chain amino acid ABC transporter permease [Desulfomonilaceae bacterium]
MDIKRDYYEDVELFKTNTALALTVLLLAALVALPFLVGDYTLYVLNLIAINSIVAIGLNILVGYTGQISLGHAGFFAIGAYSCVLLMVKGSIPFIVALPVAGLIAALFGFVLGLPSLRLEGPYLAIATLGFGMAVTQIISHLEFTGGHMGIEAPKMAIGSLVADTGPKQYAVIIIVAVALAIAALNLMKTRVGRAFVAIRDSDIAAEAMGINISWYKTLSFAVSAFYAGIGGALMAFALEHVSAGSFNLMLSVTFLAMVIVGGLGSVMGSILGAALLTYLQIKLQIVQEAPWIGPFLLEVSKRYLTVEGLANIQSIVFGAIMIAIVVFEPLGINGIYLRFKRYWRMWPF